MPYQSCLYLWFQIGLLRWKIPRIATEDKQTVKCPQLDVVYFYSSQTWQPSPQFPLNQVQISHNLLLVFCFPQEKRSHGKRAMQLTTSIVVHICFSSEVTFDHMSFSEILCLGSDDHCEIAVINSRCVVLRHFSKRQKNNVNLLVVRRKSQMINWLGFVLWWSVLSVVAEMVQSGLKWWTELQHTRSSRSDLPPRVITIVLFT